MNRRLSDFIDRCVNNCGDSKAFFSVALEKIDQDKPDLVVMDIMLSGPTNGLEAAAQIRQSYNLPIIFVSAITNSLEELKSEDKSVIHFVQKPYTEKSLPTAIKYIFE